MPKTLIKEFSEGLNQLIRSLSLIIFLIFVIPDGINLLEIKETSDFEADHILSPSSLLPPATLFPRPLFRFDSHPRICLHTRDLLPLTPKTSSITILSLIYLNSSSTNHITQSPTPSTYATVDFNCFKVKLSKEKEAWVRVGTLKCGGFEGPAKEGGCRVEARRDQRS